MVRKGGLPITTFTYSVCMIHFIESWPDNLLLNSECSADILENTMLYKILVQNHKNLIPSLFDCHNRFRSFVTTQSSDYFLSLTILVHHSFIF